MFEKIAQVQFPEFQKLSINMMPIIVGHPDSVPKELHGYLDMINASGFSKGSFAYLTVTESAVTNKQTQRRGGVHTDGTNIGGWGGWGGWGGMKYGEGIFIASTDGRTRLWNYKTKDVDRHGTLLHKPVGEGEVADPNTMYWLTDRTPHESLQSQVEGERQFFRLVADKISMWWEQHSTPNPFGIMPNAPIVKTSKF